MNLLFRGGGGGGGMKKLLIYFGGNYKLGYFGRSFLYILGFFKAKVHNGNVFWGITKLQGFFFFFFFFGGGGMPVIPIFLGWG